MNKDATLFAAKKALVILALSAAGCFAVGYFSDFGMLYSGFFAGFLGAAFIFNAWCKYLRSIGRYALPKIKREQPERAPFFHSSKNEINGIGKFFRRKLLFDDDLPESMEDAMGENFSYAARMRLLAAAYCFCGVVMLVSSYFLRY